MLLKGNSLLYEIEVENIHENIYKDKKLFDLSNIEKIKYVTIIQIT